MMSRGSVGLLWTGLTLAACSSGCAMWDTGRSWFTGQRHDQSEPKVEDKWTDIGQELRAKHPHEQADWFDRYLTSDKAREINKNFGID